MLSGHLAEGITRGDYQCFASKDMSVDCMPLDAMRAEVKWRRAWRRLRMATFITVAARSVRVTLEAATRHHLHPVSMFLRAGGELDLRRAQYRGTELVLRPDEWFCLSAFGQLLQHGAEVRKANDGFEISLASGRTFEIPSERLLPSALCMLDERFVQEEYEALEVAGAVVIDVGANIGDSAVYFADKGAVHVYAFEPFHEPYATAVRVVRRNMLEHMVTVSPRGVGAQCGRGTGVYNPIHNFWTLASSHQPAPRVLSSLPSNRTEAFELVSLRSVLDQAKEDHPTRPLVLKMDCEGCEFEAFDAEGIRESLAAVNSIVLEVHPDDCHPRETLRGKLEGYGFSVQALGGSPSLLIAERKGDGRPAGSPNPS